LAGQPMPGHTTRNFKIVFQKLALPHVSPSYAPWVLRNLIFSLAFTFDPLRFLAPPLANLLSLLHAPPPLATGLPFVSSKLCPSPLSTYSRHLRSLPCAAPSTGLLYGWRLLPLAADLLAVPGRLHCRPLPSPRSRSNPLSRLPHRNPSPFIPVLVAFLPCPLLPRPSGPTRAFPRQPRAYSRRGVFLIRLLLACFN